MGLNKISACKYSTNVEYLRTTRGNHAIEAGGNVCFTGSLNN